MKIKKFFTPKFYPYYKYNEYGVLSSCVIHCYITKNMIGNINCKMCVNCLESGKSKLNQIWIKCSKIKEAIFSEFI